MGVERNPRPAVEYETAEIRLGDRVQTLRRPVVPPGADFSEAAVVDAARKSTGLHFFGEESFRPNLRVLIRAMEDESDFNAFGRFLAQRTLIARLADRLRAQDLFDRFPEILERKLGPMTFIVGAARSGTTRTHRLMARDPRFLYLRDWEINFPVPTAKSFGARPDPRIARARGAHAAFLAMNPENQHIHTLEAEAPEEEIGLLNMSFCGMMLEAQRWVPSFGRWCLETNQSAAYRYMKRLLQLIAWFRDDDASRPWVFKSPQHMQDLDALIDIFPDAKIVFIHRDPRKTIPSGASLVWNISIIGSDHNDPVRLGAYYLDKIDRQIQKVARERKTLVPRGQQLDVLYSDMNADWRREMRRIYHFIGLAFTAETEAAMAAAPVDRDKAKGHHHYALGDFGIDRAELDRRFVDYVGRHRIPREE